MKTTIYNSSEMLVKALQLHISDYYNGDMTGIWDTETKLAFSAWSQKHGLPILAKNAIPSTLNLPTKVLQDLQEIADTLLTDTDIIVPTLTQVAEPLVTHNPKPKSMPEVFREPVVVQDSRIDKDLEKQLAIKAKLAVITAELEKSDESEDSAPDSFADDSGQ